MQKHKILRCSACLAICALTGGSANLARAEVYYEEVPVLDVAPIIASRNVPVQTRICEADESVHRASKVTRTDVREQRPLLSISEAVQEDRRLWRELTASKPLCQTLERYEQREVVLGYRVEYVYGSELFVTRMDHDPGERLRVRIELQTTDSAESRFHNTLTSSRRPRYRR